MTRSRLRTAVCGLFASLALLACGDDAEDSAAVAATPQVQDAWARASADGQANGAAYMVIAGGEADDRLIAVDVSPDVAARAEIHETVMGGTTTTGNTMSPGNTMSTGDTMTMRELESLDIPAEQDVELAPGGYHIMLMDLAEPLVADARFDLTLTFEDAGDLRVDIEVRTP